MPGLFQVYATPPAIVALPAPPAGAAPAAMSPVVLTVPAGSPWQAGGFRVPAPDGPGGEGLGSFPAAGLPADPARPAEAALPDRGAPAQDESNRPVPDGDGTASQPAGPGADTDWFAVLGDGWALTTPSDGSAPDAATAPEEFEAAAQVVFGGQEE
jgi:hypothetical protein